MKKSTPKSKATPRNYFMVNMSARDRAELEKLCRESGTNLKTMAYYAVRDIGRKLKNSMAGKSDEFYCERIQLFLPQGDIRALKFFARDFKFVNGENLARVAQFILRLALCRPAMVNAWMDAMVSYCDAENVEQNKFLADSVASRRQYRRVKIARNV